MSLHCSLAWLFLTSLDFVVINLVLLSEYFLLEICLQICSKRFVVRQNIMEIFRLGSLGKCVKQLHNNVLGPLARGPFLGISFLSEGDFRQRVGRLGQVLRGAPI